MKKQFCILFTLPLILSSCAMDVSLNRAKQLASTYNVDKLTEKSGSITTIVNSLYGIGEQGLALKQEKLDEGYSDDMLHIENISNDELSNFLVSEEYLENIASKNDYDLTYIIDNNQLSIKRDYSKTDDGTKTEIKLNIRFDANGLLNTYNETCRVKFADDNYYYFSYSVYTIWEY